MGAKANFDEINKIINITAAPDVNGDVFISVRTDLYSDGKEDWIANENLRKFQFPITAVGGQDLPGEAALGATFFLASDWKIRPYPLHHRLVVTGNLYAADGSDPFIDPDGEYAVRIMSQISALVFRVETGVSGLTAPESVQLLSLPDAGEVADAVRTELTPELDDVAIIKQFVANRLRVNKNTGDWTVYADDGETPLYTGTIADDGTFKDRVPA